ncbi:MAG: RluA family pseudouridine synthase [Helicobacter sp.]|nr:RluA family pseudouridine synthase [Helicobacter sp.]
MRFVQQTFVLPTPTKLCVFLTKQFHIPHSKAQQWLDSGRVTHNGMPCHKGQEICGAIEVATLQNDVESVIAPFFTTPYFVAFNKPAFLLCHPKGRFAAPTLLDSVYAALGSNAMLLHRLDKETSGLVLASKQPHARTLGALFETRQIRKTYRALCVGRIEAPMRIALPIYRPQKGGDLSIKSLVSHSGKHAITEIVPLCYDADSNTTLIDAIPHTGRTHQIRVHLDAIGHHIVGDPLYGAPASLSRAYLNREIRANDYATHFGAKRLMLHAARLEFAFLGLQFAIACEEMFW